MTSSNPPSSLSSQVLFEIVLNDASVINKIVAEISNPDDNSTFVITKEGLKLIVNGDRTSQVSAFFSTNTFDSFVFNADDCIRYKFSLKDFIETLNLLKEEADENQCAKASLRMTYCRRGDPLRMRLDNMTNYTVECDLREFSQPSTQFLMSFSDFEETAEIQLHSKEFYKFICGLDLTSSVFVKLILQAGEIPVRMITESSTMGEVELEVRPHNQDDMGQQIVMRDLDIPTNMIYSFNYRCKFITPALEALKNSEYVRMKCGQSGLLLMEHFHSIGQVGVHQSVQYFVLSEAA